MDWTKQCAHFRQIFPLTKRRTDKHIKYEMWEILSLISLLQIVGEKLPPSQRSSLEMTRAKRKLRGKDEYDVDKKKTVSNFLQLIVLRRHSDITAVI